jgi:hypothetical protein
MVGYSQERVESSKVEHLPLHLLITLLILTIDHSVSQLVEQLSELFALDVRALEQVQPLKWAINQ